MPWHITKSSQCPTDKPWAVIKNSDNSVAGCHATEESAINQMKALYANEKSQIPPEVQWRAQTTGLMRAEFRLKSAGNKSILSGHAAVFNQLSEELGFHDSFREIIKPGAFRETLKTADVRALWNHDPNYPLGRVQSKTLRLAEDAVGLAVEIDMPDTDYARNIMVLVERGDVNGMSFAFGVPEGGDSWRRSDDGMIRELNAVNLFDVSPVTFPAYTQTDLGVRKEIRSLAEQLFSERQIIELKLNVTDQQAKRIAKHLRYENMDECMADQKAQGYSEESAKMICSMVEMEYGGYEDSLNITDEDAQSIARDLRYDSWEACISDQLSKGYSQESADKICGMIKAEYGGASKQPVKSAREIILAAKIPLTEADKKRQHENFERWKERREFLDARSPKDEFSYQQALKAAKKTDY